MENHTNDTPSPNLSKKILYLLCAAACLLPWVSPPLALGAGFIFSFTLGQPYPTASARALKVLLQWAVVGLAFGISLQQALAAGTSGFFFTLSSIIATLIMGTLLGRMLKVEKITSTLIAAGTAICGGSAIAALVPILKAPPARASIALACVFVLNSVALFIFPPLGHLLHFSQQQFGMWCAIAIHDTSSVVGAAQNYGHQALQTATTVKLERALYIIPLSLIYALRSGTPGRIKLPWFILFFVIALLINSYVPASAIAAPYIYALAKRMLVLSLFLIGAGINLAALKGAGTRPMLQALGLWLAVSILSAIAIKMLV